MDENLHRILPLSWGKKKQNIGQHISNTYNGNNRNFDKDIIVVEKLKQAS